MAVRKNRAKLCDVLPVCLLGENQLQDHCNVNNKNAVFHPGALSGQLYDMPYLGTEFRKWLSCVQMERFEHKQKD